MKIEGYTQYGTMVAAEVPNNSIFRDVADNLMKSKDNAGVITELITTGGGDVSKVGTPVGNQIAIWTADGIIEGVPDLTFTGNEFKVGIDTGVRNGKYLAIYGSSSTQGGAIHLYNGDGADDIHEAYVIRAQSGKLEIKAWNDEIITYTSLTDHFNIASSTVQFSSYGSGTIIGTPTYGLGVDVSGNVIETALPSVSKVGTPLNDQIGVWTGDGTLEGASNLIFSNGSAVLSVGSTADEATLILNGGNNVHGGKIQLGVGTFGDTDLYVTNYIIESDFGDFTMRATGPSNAGTILNFTSSTGEVDIPRITKISEGYTVATLPTGAVGQRAYVTDATAPTYLGTLTGGGAITCPVFHNGTEWVSN